MRERARIVPLKFTVLIVCAFLAVAAAVAQMSIFDDGLDVARGGIDAAIARNGNRSLSLYGQAPMSGGLSAHN